jgi:hypothetical protein
MSSETDQKQVNSSLHQLGTFGPLSTSVLSVGEPFSTLEEVSNSPPPSEPPHPLRLAPRQLPSQFRLNFWTWVLALIAGIWLAATLVYAWAVSVTTGPLTKLVPHSVSRSLTVLRVASEVAGFLLAALCASTLEVIVWAVASSKRGITMSSFLGISSSTGIFGLPYLLKWKTNPRDRDYHRIWVGKR